MGFQGRQRVVCKPLSLQKKISTLPGLLLAFSVLALSAGFVGKLKKQNISYSGLALELSSNEPVYKEEHEEYLENGKHTLTYTYYKDPNGKLIATRKMDFTKNLAKPDYKLEDFRNGYIEGASVLNEKEIKVFSRKNRNEQLSETLLSVPEPCVIDGGFNHFVKSHWEEMMKGKVFSFNFVAPIKKDFYKFRIRKIREEIQNGKPAVEIYLEIDNFLLRAFVDPIKIEYDVQSRRIIAYRGISNINNSEGKSYVVKLEYPNYGP